MTEIGEDRSGWKNNRQVVTREAKEKIEVLVGANRTDFKLNEDKEGIEESN